MHSVHLVHLIGVGKDYARESGNYKNIITDSLLLEKYLGTETCRNALCIVWVVMPKNLANNCANTSPVAVHSTGAEVNSVMAEEARRTIDEAGLITPKDMCRIQLTMKMAINTLYRRTIKLSSTRERNNLAHDNNVAGRNTLKIFNKV